MSKKFDFIDLFAGCGGLSLGLEQAGFNPVLVNEIMPQFAETYRINRELDKSSVFVGDIRDLNADFAASKSKFDKITLVCGGPPCQGFSMANRQRIIDDPRNMLYKEYLKFLCSVRPAFFIMENVRGMQSRWEEIESDFNTYLNRDGHEYNFTGKLLLAEDYGVPQHRERLYIVGHIRGKSRQKIFPIPPKTQSEGIKHIKNVNKKSF